MTEENDLRVSYDEVTRLSCKCGTELVFNLNLPEYKDGKWDWQRKQLRCTVCGDPFDSAILEGLNYFTAWLRCIDKAPKHEGENMVFFRLNRGAI
jgi:hypothetical protein